MDWFLNYRHKPYRETSFNLAVARVLVCVLAAWKVTAYPFAGLAAFPPQLLVENAIGQRLWTLYAPWIGWEQGLAAACLLACAVGLAPGLAAFVASVAMAHLSAAAWPVTSDKTWLPTVYFLLLYAIFRDEDRYVLWPFPKSRPEPRLARAGGTDASSRAPLHSLEWFLLMIAVIYFLTGIHKIEHGVPFLECQHGPHFLEWPTPTNMARMMERGALGRGMPLPAATAWLLEHPFLLGAMGITTLLFELGLLAAVLANRFLTPCLLGLAAMHLGIWFTMRLNYLTDFGAMYLVFVPWDTLFGMPTGQRRAP